MPSLKRVDHPSEAAYELIENLSNQALAEKATQGRPTSMLSKLAHAVSPLVYIPYDSRVQNALRVAGKGVRPHQYRDYMRTVFRKSLL